MTSRHEKSLTMFSIAFMVVVFVPGEPGDADRFPFLPETFRRVAKKFGTDAAYRAASAMFSA